MSKERITISQLKEYSGKVIESCFVLKFAKLGLSEKAEWVNASLEDQSGAADAVIFKEAIPPTIRQMVGQVVKVKGMVGLRSSEIQLKVKEISLAPEGEFELSDFAPGLTEEQREMLTEELNGLIESVKEPKLNCLLKTAFGPAAVKAFAMLPGGHSHHSFNGGLLVHTIEVAKITDDMIALDEADAKYHKDHITVNRDIAITGALLHDIGKGKEFVPFPFNKRRENSYFVGFPSAGVTIIDRYIEAIEKANKGVTYGRVRDVLENIAAACHVTYRDCVPPRTKEAILVRLADKASADRDVVDTDLCSFMAEHPDEAPGMIYSEYFRCSITLEDNQSISQKKEEKEAKN